MRDTKLFLFGSAARGDNDPTSDIDVLAVYPDVIDENHRDIILQKLKLEFGERVALAEYSSARIDEMFAEGHLFAWHLYSEAKQFFFDESAKDNIYIFHKPEPYLNAEEDAMRFLDLLRSVDFKINSSTYGSPVHEAGLVYLALRNIGMALSSKHFNRPDFTRHSPFNLSTKMRIDPPCEPSTYNSMIAARHSSQRGFQAPLIDLPDFAAEVKECINWAERALGRSDE
jgi:predicted nucleotidyltransferase